MEILCWKAKKICSKIGNFLEKIVKEKSILRKLIRTSNEIMESSYVGETDVMHILEDAEKGIFDISQEKTGDNYLEVGIGVVKDCNQGW